mgnify:CR=1 FL=1
MNEAERKSLINESIKKIHEKISCGCAGGYLIITDKKTGKYVQCSIHAGEEYVLIEVPEGQLSAEEIDKVLNVLSRFSAEKDIIGFQIRVDTDKAPDVIEKIFLNGFNLPNDFDIEIEILE